MSNLYSIGSIGVSGNVSIGGNMSAANMGTMRNKIINGDMRVDRSNLGAGHAVVSTSATSSNVAASVSRFEAVTGVASGAVCADQVVLNATDKAAVGGAFDRAVQLSALPTAGLIGYLPFEGSNVDVSGAGFLGAPTVTGTAAYSGQARVGDRSLDLTANTAGGTQIASTNYAFTPSNASISVSFWLNPSVNNINYQVILGMGDASVSSSAVVQVVINNAGQIYVDVFYNTVNYIVNGSSSTVIQNNVWTLVTFTASPSDTTKLYFNSSLVGTSTSVTPIGSSFNFINRISIGGSIGTSKLYAYKGLIDDVRIYNRVLSPSEIAALASFSGIPAAPASGLIARLPFDSALTDSVGLLTSPTMTGTAVYTPNCKSGSAALDLTANTAGSSGSTYVDYTYTQTSPNVSISCWIYPSTVTGAPQVMVSIGDNNVSENSAIQFVVSITGLPYIDVSYGASYYSALGASQISSLTWTHIACTMTPNDYAKLYINGNLFASSTTVITNGSTFGTNNRLRIGAKVGTSKLYAYKGLVDDVRIYNTALTPSQVAGLYYSYSPAGYSLYRQPIDGTQLQDLAWGTSAAQPATLSCWLKNQSATAQQYTLSVNNSGHGLVAYLPFEGSATDDLSTLTGPVVTGTLAYSSSAKVGTQCMDLTANTASSTTLTTGADYSWPSNIIPQTISFWINLASNTALQVPLCFGNSAGKSPAWGLGISAQGRPYIDAYTTGTIYQQTSTNSPQLAINTWYHIGMTLIAGGNSLLYVNGVLVNSRSYSASVLLANNGGQVDALRIGMYITSGLTDTVYKGLIDDIRIYNRVLSPTDIAAIYTANASSTALTTALMPRSIIYNTPAIPANSWQRVSVTVPGDTTGYWMSSSNATAAHVSLCLGAGSTYATSNAAAASNNSVAAWNALPEYTGATTQVFGASSNNLLALPGSSVVLTGLQLERGDVATSFESRPYVIESVMSGLSMDSAGRVNLSVDGNISAENLGMFRNRIINGDMRIDQRNAGAAVTVTSNNGVYLVDRLMYFTNSGSMSCQQVVDAPSGTGLVSSAKVTVNTASSNGSYTGFLYKMEGNTVADLEWGKATAQPATISFWVKTSMPGTHSFSVLPNSGGNKGAYLTTYTVSTGNVWEYKTVSVPPATSSANATSTDNTLGIELRWYASAASGDVSSTLNTWLISSAVIASTALDYSKTVGATFQLTGVQLEKGTIATPFEIRPYQTEMQLCQRYFNMFADGRRFTNEVIICGQVYAADAAFFYIRWPYPMRTIPTLTLSAPSHFLIHNNTGNAAGTSTGYTASGGSLQSIALNMTGSSGMVAGNATQLRANNASARMTIDAEL